jgi:hypothetical protein
MRFPCFKAYFLEVTSHWRIFYKIWYTWCLKIREFRIQNVVGKGPVELEKKSLFLKNIQVSQKWRTNGALRCRRDYGKRQKNM